MSDAPHGRLLLRLTARCNSRCAHCGIADLAGMPDRAAADAVAELRAARARGCDEVVFLRGEATLRNDLAAIANAARTLGYKLIQVQTNGGALADDAVLARLMAAGVNFFEVSFFGHVAPLHDAVDGTTGAFARVTAALINLARRRAAVLVTVPVVRRNYVALSMIAARLAQLGVRRVQFNLPRPVRVDDAWNTAALVPLGEASPFIRAAIREARALGMRAEAEAVPFCHLDESMRDGLDAAESFARHAVSDLHRREDSMEEHRRASRPRAPQCAACDLVERCPTTWAAAQDLYGTASLVPIRRR
jgi:MoaA/NifB/PqqE/SkfB family radical SAM enzyme